MPSTAGEPGGTRGPDQAAGLRPPYFVADGATLDGAGSVPGPGRIVLRGQEGRHATTVRRLTPGEQAYVTDGAGRVAECVVAATRPGELELAVVGVSTEIAPQPSVTVVQAIPKGERGELAVELLTEVGADVVVPWAAARCVAVWRGDRAAKSLARWQRAAIEAAKQSRRAWFPEVTAQADLAGVASRVKAAALAVLLDPQAGPRVADLQIPAAGEVMLIVGPEGGITAAEYEALTGAGAIGARLGPTVLRASSAGVVAAGLVLSRTGRW